MTDIVMTALRERLARERARREATADLPARLATLAGRLRTAYVRNRSSPRNGMRRPVTTVIFASAAFCPGRKARRPDRGQKLVESLRGRGDVRMTTDEVIALMRGPTADEA
jgi:hypothetical protein